MNQKIKLSGFNNLTKCLSFNLYEFCVARNSAEVASYQGMIVDMYRSEKVTHILKGICEIIEANILNVSDQDYDPWGASSMVLMSDLKGQTPPHGLSSPGVNGFFQAAHLDKSHMCAHTYPDIDEKSGICSFRIDIDIATCGDITPLKALNFMLDHFDSDIVVVDYVVRGFTRDVNGKKCYNDQKFNSIQSFIRDDIRAKYFLSDLCLDSENIWQTKMLRMDIDRDSYFLDASQVDQDEKQAYIDTIKLNMREVLHMFPE